MSLRGSIIRAGLRGIDLTRADLWLGPLARGAGVILMFHHVRPFRGEAFSPNRLLEITPEFLDIVLTLVRETGFDIIPIDAMPGRLRQPGDRPFAVLTFDDGYRDNAEYAMPVLRQHAAPATFFITTGYAEGEARLWWLELQEAVRRLQRIKLQINDEVLHLEARDAQEKQAAFDLLYWKLRAGDEETLLAHIATLARMADLDSRALTRDLCMTWPEIATVAAEPLITIGAHTLTHPMLAKHPEERARTEIADSKAVIEAKLGVPVRHFAYPVGDPGSAGPRDFVLAREAGFETAVTTRPGHVFSGHADHLHALPRVSINGLHQDEAAIRSLLSGVPFMLWNKGRRLNVA